MTFIIGMQCNDGVLIASDSVSISTAGSVTNTGVKHLQGVRCGQPFALAFAGYAGIENGPQTLTVIEKATRELKGDLVDNLGQHLQDWLYAESFRGRKRTRKEFRRISHVRVFISVGRQAWWLIDAKPQGFAKSRMAHRSIAIGQPGPDHAAWQKLRGAIPVGPEWLVDGKKVAGMLFELGTQLFPSAARYPGTATTHNEDGVSLVIFRNQSELV